MKKDDCVLNYCFVLVEKGIRVGICHSVYQYAKANNKHMKDYDKLSYIQYWNVNNLYRWKMLQKLPANTFEKIKDTSQFNDDFIKKYIDESDEGYFLEVDIQNVEKLHELHNDLPFLPEAKKKKNSKKFVANLHDKTGYIVHISNLKQLSILGFFKFNHNPWLKPYIEYWSIKKVKKDFEKDFF